MHSKFAKSANMPSPPPQKKSNNKFIKIPVRKKTQNFKLLPNPLNGFKNIPKIYRQKTKQILNF